MYHLAQINIAQMKGKDVDDPIMKDFVDNIDRINQLAEASPGFVWRLKDDEDNALSINPFPDNSLLINVSVWEDVKSLEQYVYHSMHVEIMKRKREWFHHFNGFYYALWWIKAGAFPSAQQAAEKLKQLQVNGPSQEVFTFKEAYPPPAINESL